MAHNTAHRRKAGCLVASAGEAQPQDTGGAAIKGLIIEGERNDTLFRRVACSMRGRGADYPEILAALFEARDRCEPGSEPMPDSELEKIARSAMRYPPNSAKAVGAGGA